MHVGSGNINASENGAAIQREPVAIIGMGCRLPGQASSPSKLWELLIQKKSGLCDVPISRYNAEGFYHSDAERPGSINSDAGYFIQEDIHAFENAFFSINNLEATYMDPQQRKLLEVVYESFESAGVPLDKINGSNTGVYIGNFTLDFMIMQYKDPEYFSRYSATGTGLTVLANRITHCFDLRGPSVVLDTACSSSLYALHFACLALDAHDCDAAVVASANLIQSPEQQLLAVKAGILSSDSTCHTFDEAANGYGRAEGVSSLYLKRLSDAIRDGDPIRSVIRGTAVNGNGRTPGIVQPSVKGQEAVIRTAYRRAGLPVNGTDYVEAHGTGTKVGDPIEVEAISHVFHHMTGRPTLIGGIKPSIGHSEGASGLSSIIKVALSLEKGVIPATIGVNKINSTIKTDDWKVEITTAHSQWPQSLVHRASVNSFGFGGANSHGILEAATTHIPLQHGEDPLLNSHSTSAQEHADDGLILLIFSARTEHSLSQLVDDLAEYASKCNEPLELRDLAYTLGCRRSRLTTRGYLLASHSSLQSDLDPSKLSSKSGCFSAKLPFAFVYTGQGAQWSGMGSQLIHQYAVFRSSIRYLDSCLQNMGSEFSPSWSLEATLVTLGEASDIHLAEKSQPVCTAVQIALTDLLHGWGILPQVVVGHSSGEIGAAYAAGLLTSRQAIMAAFCRGLAVSRCQSVGGMVVIGVGQSKAQEIMTELAFQDNASIACINSPESCTISGDEDVMDKLCNILQKREIVATKLNTNGKAYHSHHMKVIGPWYQSMLESVWHTQSGSANRLTNGSLNGCKIPSVRMISTVTGDTAVPAQVISPVYWRQNLESPVRFEDAIRVVLKGEKHHFIEVGPHSSLELPIRQTATRLNKAQDHYLYSSMLVRGKDATVTALNLVGTLFLHGHDELPYENMIVDGPKSKLKDPKFLLDLPTYPWDYTAPSLLHEPRSVTEFRNRKYLRHDLLGSQVPGGNKLTTTWRNNLDLNEIPWLRDHCLGPSIVFPAAAYLAMAVEAMCQVSGFQLHECPGVDLRNFNFLKALDFHPEQRPKVEIFTEMRQSWVSSTAVSNRWWHFSVISLTCNEAHPTVHANGLVSLSEESQALVHRQIQLKTGSMDQQATRVWYDKFTKEGLNWGPHFAVMEEIFCDRARQAHQACATTHLLRGGNSGSRAQLQYLVHPITIDAMLQTAFVATTGGWVKNLRATVPVTMDSVHFSPLAMLDMNTCKKWFIDSVSEIVGFGTVKIAAELYNPSDQVLVRMGNVRCIAYQGSIQNETPEQRNPLARVTWKPDITALSAGANNDFSRYLDWFAESCNARGIMANENVKRLAGSLDLVVHKRPYHRILELDGQPETTALFLNVLCAESSLRRFSCYFKGSVSANGRLLVSELAPGESSYTKGSRSIETVSKDERFDLVICSATNSTLPSNLKDWLTPSITVIARGTFEQIALPEIKYEKVVQETDQDPAPVTVAMTARVLRPEERLKRRHIVIVNREGGLSALDANIQSALHAFFGHTIQVIGLPQISEKTLLARSIVISTIEAEQPLLNTITEQDMNLVKFITDTASTILWITNADLLSGTRPDFALVLGLSRALMLEQPSLRFAVFDVENVSKELDITARNVCGALQQLIENEDTDFELAQKGSVVHTSRCEPEEALNTLFKFKQNEETIDMRLEATGRCELSTKQPGQMDTIHFVKKEYRDTLRADHVEIQVKSVGMNAKDLYVLGAKVDTKDASCSCECAGVITSVGADVQDLRPGDRVVAMAPGHFATHERLPHWAVCKLRDNEGYTTASTIPIVFSTAIYALKHRANLQPGESVLIHSAAGGVGIAAIQLAKQMGAKIFATVGNESKKTFLVDTYNLNPAHIFSSRDSSFLPAILSATSGQGVDVVLNSLTHDLLHDSFKACAEFGRFVEIGKRDIIDHGSLDMATFGRNVSLIAFDLSSLYLSSRPSHHKLWQKLLNESMGLVRSGAAKHCSPLEIFGASKIVQAFRHFSLGTRMGKVAVSFENGNSRLKVTPDRYETVLSPNKSYLMIGCLGGLGRSLSRWMMKRGARNFVFLNPSGLDKPVAQVLVHDLREQGAVADVVRGDVGDREDVERAIQAARQPIGGLVQAAMGLSQALWSSMSKKSWHASIRPKVQGTWNLHNALLDGGRDGELDFFVMTSSISGTVGTATESNYCSSNAFLDSFARYRNSLGLPAISVGLGRISEVGYLHEHPDIERLMKRKGIAAINEDELLQIMDLALTHQHPRTWKCHHDNLVNSHLLTGIEFMGLKEQRDHGFEGDNHVLADPRASLFAAAFARSTNAVDGRGAATRRGVPEELAKALQDGSSVSVLDAVRTIVAKKISNLILLPVENLKPEQHLGEFGLDSMLAAEFRTFIFKTLEVDVPFMTLLAKSTSVNSLAQLITDGFEQRMCK